MCLLPQQHQIGQSIPVEVAGGQCVDGELAVVYRPSFRRAPTVGALVIQDDQFLRVAVISQVRLPVSVQVRHHQRRNPFLRRDGLNAEAGVGRQVVDFPLLTRQHGQGVRFAGPVIEQIDLGSGVVDHDQVRQAVPVEVRRVQQADLGVNGKNLRPREPKRGGSGGRVGGAARRGQQRARQRPQPQTVRDGMEVQHNKTQNAITPPPAPALSAKKATRGAFHIVGQSSSPSRNREQGQEFDFLVVSPPLPPRNNLQ